MSIKEYFENESKEVIRVESKLKNFNDLQNLVDFSKNYLKNKKICEINAKLLISYKKRV